MRYLFALGGNAFGKGNMSKVAEAISSIYKNGDAIVITHGNGPQVGELFLQQRRNLAVLTGETEAEMGLEIAESVSSKLRGLDVPVILTRVLVDGGDKEFRNPSKPIGKFYKARREVEGLRKGFRARKLIGGYRLVVPSPRPLEILNIDEIELSLLKNRIAVAGGGGGIAVIRSGKKERLADAVLDKDYTSALIAGELDVDMFLILTDVDGAYLDFSSPKRKLIGRIKAKTLERLAGKGYFEKGSMLPKVKACIGFVENTGRTAAIGSIAKISEVVKLKSTVIVP